MILAEVSLRKREERKSATPLLRLIIGQLSNATRCLKNHSLRVGTIAGALAFFGLLFDFELFGSVMAILSLLTLWMSEEGGRK